MARPTGLGRAAEVRSAARPPTDTWQSTAGALRKQPARDAQHTGVSGPDAPSRVPLPHHTHPPSPCTSLLLRRTLPRRPAARDARANDQLITSIHLPAASLLPYSMLQRAAAHACTPLWLALAIRAAAARAVHPDRSTCSACPRTYVRMSTCECQPEPGIKVCTSTWLRASRYTYALVLEMHCHRRRTSSSIDRCR